MRVLYLISCVLMIISLTGCASSCTQVKAQQGPSEFGSYIDKQWDKPLQGTLDWTYGECSSPGHDRKLDVQLISSDTPVNIIPSQCTLYVYPSEWVTRTSGMLSASYIKIYPIIAEQNGWYVGSKMHSGGTAQLVSDARVGGTEKEPVMAARFKLDIHTEGGSYQDLYCLMLTYFGVSGSCRDHQWVIVKLK